jgi:surface protein
MFQGSNSLEEINVSSFNTSRVTTMNNMFLGCSSLKEIDLSSFDTSSVTDM